MSYPDVFEGWAAHGKDCLEGKFKKTQYKPKVGPTPLAQISGYVV